MTIYCTTHTRFKAAESRAAIARQRALSPNAVVEQSSLWLRWPSPATRENFPARSDGAFGTALDVGLATGQRHQLPLSETAQGFHLHRRTPHTVDHAPPRPVRAALPCGLVPRAASGSPKALRPLPGWSVSTDNGYYYPSEQLSRTEPLAGGPFGPTVEPPKPPLVDLSVSP